ncbi:MAG: hypothetical protein ACJAWW_002495 [Sulfurimonas sp.]|jgi:hypothetical protein
MHKNDTKQHNELLSLLIKCLPRQVNASNHKSTANNRVNRNRDRLEALKHYAFMQFNSPKIISLMIFDIDFINGKKAIDVFSLYDMVYEIERVTSCRPTYVLQTTKGYHFAFHLEKPVFLHQPKAKKYLKDVKEAIIDSLSCDKIASSRLYGIWRNPLVHDFWYSREIEYDLSSFKHLIKRKKCYTDTRETRNPLSVSINQVVEGQRNNKLFLFAVNYCLSNPFKTFESLTAYLLNINKQAKPPLDELEVLNIAKSVFKRKEARTLFLPKLKERDIQTGIMNFPRMAKLSRKDYNQETKRRQYLSAARTNDMKSYASKQEAMKIAQATKIKLTKSKILYSLRRVIALFIEQDKKLSYVNIAKECQLDRRTVKKYIDSYKLL